MQGCSVGALFSQPYTLRDSSGYGKKILVFRISFLRVGLSSLHFLDYYELAEGTRKRKDMETYDEKFF
jgi:hypothetical protein